jgi:hypothetical protein
MAAMAKDSQSFVTNLGHPHERMFSGPFVRFQPAIVGQPGPASSPAGIADAAKELEVMG